MTLIDEYLEESIKYSTKYGNNTIVLMQVGHFYEAYAVDNDIEKINADNLERLANIMNIQVTRKNKSIVENSRGNPIMIGVNIYSIDKYIQILLNAFFTIVVIDQVGQPPFVKREVSNIYSPGTNIQYDIGDTNNLVCIYLEEIEVKKNFLTNLCCGITSIDLATGKNTVYETFSKKDDFNFALDELFKFIQIYDPKELLIICKNVNLLESELTSYLHLTDRIVHFRKDIDCDAQFFQINYQNQFLSRVFKNTGILSPIEYVGLESLPFATTSYIFLLQFAYEHSEKIIYELDIPIIWQLEKHLSLTNNTINQLNLVANTSINCKTKFNSLFAVINNTSTTIGKRCLRDRLLNPIVNRNELENRYSTIEEFMTPIDGKELYKLVEQNLNKVVDLERAHRRISLGIFQPTDIFGVYNSYKNIEIIQTDLIDVNLDKLNKISFNNDEHQQLCGLISSLETVFNLDECVKYHQDKITGNIFNIGIVPQIDDICNSIDNLLTKLKELNICLSRFIGSKNRETMIKLEHNDRDGYYFTTTNKRAVMMKNALKEQKTLVLSGLNISVKNDIEFKNTTKSSTKIISPLIKEISNKIIVTTEKLKAISKTIFLGKLNEYMQKYGRIMSLICKFVANIDLTKSACKTAQKWGYVRPKILDHKQSFIVAKNIRHPIIERLGNNDEYISNDLALGLDMSVDDFNSFFEGTLDNKELFNDSRGMLLFGTNASGKSSLMKAVGINIILAQSGHYVAASDFAFLPFTNLFTRINNNDNIFKGESSFAVEMSELRSILKRADKNSLVLGDELCAGTESISALSIFSSSVIKLEERGSSFIFATHLHELCNIKKITHLNCVKMFHLKVIFDMDNDTLVYDRKLEPGNGPAVYGLEVCSAMKMDQDFLLLAEEIRKDLLGIKQSVLDTKQSKYNSHVYVHLCEICNREADDVHHIKFQCTADSNKLINGSVNKDIKSNLVPLCKSCHNDVHNDKIKIYGFKQTSDGVKLDYINFGDQSIDNQKEFIKSSLGNIEKNKNTPRKRKYNDTQIEIIKLVFEQQKTSRKLMCNYLEASHNIQISVGTLNKIVNDTYL